jgi:hypothetical protein
MSRRNPSATIKEAAKYTAIAAGVGGLGYAAVQPGGTPPLTSALNGASVGSGAAIILGAAAALLSPKHRDLGLAAIGMGFIGCTVFAIAANAVPATAAALPAASSSSTTAAAPAATPATTPATTSTPANADMSPTAG